MKIIFLWNHCSLIKILKLLKYQKPTDIHVLQLYFLALQFCIIINSAIFDFPLFLLIRCSLFCVKFCSYNLSSASFLSASNFFLFFSSRQQSNLLGRGFSFSCYTSSCSHFYVFMICCTFFLAM